MFFRMNLALLCDSTKRSSTQWKIYRPSISRSSCTEQAFQKVNHWEAIYQVNSIHEKSGGDPSRTRTCNPRSRKGAPSLQFSPQHQSFSFLCWFSRGKIRGLEPALVRQRP